MGSGQSQNPQGGQMGGMGQPGGIPGGGIAGLLPQVSGQMGGFGKIVNQAVAQPGRGGVMPPPGMMYGPNDALMPIPRDPRTGAPVGALVSQPPNMFGGMGGQMPRPQGVPSTMVNPKRPMPGGQTQGTAPMRPKGFGGYR